MIDLHTHTTKSDGILPPAELISIAAKKGIRAIAITDHDSLGGLDEGEQAAAKYGVKFVPGIEISALYNTKELHLLGLFIDRTNETLINAVERWLASRRDRNRLMLARLADAGVQIDMEDLLRVAGFSNEQECVAETAITRSHFARAIIEAGYCDTTSKTFAKYLTPGTSTYVRRQVISAADAIAIIRQAGGIPILAHPLRYKLEFSDVSQIIEDLKSAGLMGIECYYSSHSSYDQERLLKVAEKYRLCVSGGSDFHGGSHDQIELGAGYGRLYIPYSVCESLCDISNKLFNE